MEDGESHPAKRQKAAGDKQPQLPPMAAIFLQNAVVSVQEDWLCDNSDFFKVCLRGGWKETVTKTVFLEQVDGHVFLLLVEVTEVMLNTPGANARQNYEKVSDRVIALLPDSHRLTTFARLVRLADFLLMDNLHYFLRRV
ncbi:hypothetical protein CI238_09132 [Colletotrichum incanum]|uniref:BTB domain-containing protein n=1 Tax=Colletotrichum incanum TaxID=1573173 RepID=A0A161Y9M2_COLIC|nr:hypothetical protein CI238_09132 [Colletotrichum incanum]